MITVERAYEISGSTTGVVTTGDDICWIVGVKSDVNEGTVLAHLIGLNADRWEDVTGLTEVVLNETITRDDNYSGHWTGTAYVTYHTYGRQIHRDVVSAERWNAQQKVLRPAR